MQNKKKEVVSTAELDSIKQGKNLLAANWVPGNVTPGKLKAE